MAENKPKEIRRQEILDVAIECFSKKGYSGTTVDEICSKANITKGGLYWHFKSKKAILTSLVNSLCQGQEVLWKNLESMEITADALKEVGLSFINSSIENKSKFRFFSILDMESNSNPCIKDALRISRTKTHNYLVRFSEKILRYYKNEVVSPTDLAQILEVSVMSIAQKKILGITEIDVVKSWNCLCELIVKGLK